MGDQDAVDAIFGLLLDDFPDAARELALQFRIRFQQLSGPVTAKSVEDTFFYRYNPLIALNEVGSHPDQALGGLADFHQFMEERAKAQPFGLSATATHDTKRGEDARARLYTLSEAPEVWAEAVRRWSAMNQKSTESTDSGPVPEPEIEWMFYQALLGAWPGGKAVASEAGLADLRARFGPYMEKALREAKLRTDWVDPNAEYEDAARRFVDRTLSAENRPFLDDFQTTVGPFMRAGALNSLSQTLIKLTAPGIPDIYQGSERLDLSLVDPDNRQMLDFASAARSLNSEETLAPSKDNLANGVYKQWLISQCLALRQSVHELFSQGAYVPLEVLGEKRNHIIAFMRRDRSSAAISVTPRLPVRLLEGKDHLLQPACWSDTRVVYPGGLTGYSDVLTHRTYEASPQLRVDHLLARHPVALLIIA